MWCVFSCLLKVQMEFAWRCKMWLCVFQQYCYCLKQQDATEHTRTWSSSTVTLHVCVFCLCRSDWCPWPCSQCGCCWSPSSCCWPGPLPSRRLWDVPTLSSSRSRGGGGVLVNICNGRWEKHVRAAQNYETEMCDYRLRLPSERKPLCAAGWIIRKLH